MKLPQCSLRDLFWLVLVCALGIGWWLERASLRTELNDVQAEAARWKSDAERSAQYLLSLPPTGYNYDSSIVPPIKPRDALPELPFASP
jgi:hypothetical protein